MSARARAGAVLAKRFPRLASASSALRTMFRLWRTMRRRTYSVSPYDMEQLGELTEMITAALTEDPPRPLRIERALAAMDAWVKEQEVKSRRGGFRRV